MTVSEQRTVVDFGHCIKDLVNVHYPDVEWIILVMDQLTTMHESAWFGDMWFEVGHLLRHNRIQNFPVVDDAPVVWGSLREWEWWLNE